jgi:hypothetical protein
VQIVASPDNVLLALLKNNSTKHATSHRRGNAISPSGLGGEFSGTLQIVDAIPFIRVLGFAKDKNPTWVS